MLSADLQDVSTLTIDGVDEATAFELLRTQMKSELEEPHVLLTTKKIQQQRILRLENRVALELTAPVAVVRLERAQIAICTEQHLANPVYLAAQISSGLALRLCGSHLGLNGHLAASGR